MKHAAFFSSADRKHPEPVRRALSSLLQGGTLGPARITSLAQSLCAALELKLQGAAAKDLVLESSSEHFAFETWLDQLKARRYLRVGVSRTSEIVDQRQPSGLTPTATAHLDGIIRELGLTHYAITESLEPQRLLRHMVVDAYFDVVLGIALPTPLPYARRCTAGAILGLEELAFVCHTASAPKLNRASTRLRPITVVARTNAHGAIQALLPKTLQAHVITVDNEGYLYRSIREMPGALGCIPAARLPGVPWAVEVAIETVAGPTTPQVQHAGPMRRLTLTHCDLWHRKRSPFALG